MKNLIRRLYLILLLGIVPFLAGIVDNSYAALDTKKTATCNTETLARLEADFQQMIKVRAEQRAVFSDEEYKAAALAYIVAAEACLQATAQPNIQADADAIIIDEGGLSPYPELGPLFNTLGFKWGNNSPYNPNGQNQPGPGTLGGTVTYSYIANGISHSFEGSGNNTDVRTGLGVNSCVQAEIANAFAAWSAVANIQFIEVADSGVASDTPGATGNIRIGAHPFDGPFKVLAHAYFPPNTGDTFFSAAGDMHFDTAGPWSCTSSGGIDIGLVALHELGHSIGLDHEPSPPGGNKAIMNPSLDTTLTGLLLDDIQGAASIYGAPAKLNFVKQVVGVDHQPGDLVTFTLTIQNSGAVALTQVVVTDTIPTDILLPTWSASASLGATPRAGTTYVWDLANLGPGATGIITVSGTINPALAADFAIVNTASSGSAETGSNSHSSTAIVGGTRTYLPFILKNN